MEALRKISREAIIATDGVGPVPHSIRVPWGFDRERCSTGNSYFNRIFNRILK
jgi:hypothetical protein